MWKSTPSGWGYGIACFSSRLPDHHRVNLDPPACICRDEARGFCSPVARVVEWDCQNVALLRASFNPVVLVDVDRGNVASD